MDSRFALALRNAAPDSADALLDLCARSADPEGALAGTLRVAEAYAARGGTPFGHPDAARAVVALAATSRFLPGVLAARPRLCDLLPAVARTGRRSLASMEAALAARARRLDPADEPGLARSLRLFKYREVARIALRDVWGAPLAEVAAELADLASAAIEAAVQFHFRRLVAAHGLPEGASEGPSAELRTGFVVLGMGKLGGEELNFSSDVDLIYLYAHDGKTAGGLPNFAFYARLAERVTRAIGEATADGFVFRVDLNLRPEGKSGPITNSARALELYHEAWGRTWERVALIKARPVAGDLDLGHAILRTLAPYVWRRSIDLAQVEELRAMKADVQKASAARRGDAIDLKLSPGGIREVEFFVQALQLLHGGRNEALRVRGTLPALDALLFAGLISARDKAELADAYVFLRRAEHRVQMLAERQTHALPVDPAEEERLARRLGLAHGTFRVQLASHREAVSASFADLLLSRGRTEPPAADPRAERALDASLPDAERAEALAALGFADPFSAVAELERLARKAGLPFGPLGKPEQAPLASALLTHAGESPHPDQALRLLAEFLSRLAAPAGTCDVLLANPPTARLLCMVFGTSEFLGRALLRHPELLDALWRRDKAAPVRSRAQLGEELAARLARCADLEEKLSVMRRLKNEEVLRVGLHDVSGALEVAAVQDQLTDLADALIEAALQMAAEEMFARFGRPADPAVSVLGLGSLGGRELGYHSDLDLIFLNSGAGGVELHSRLAQRLISHLAVPTREGYLYRIDTRLRPSGSKGSLVSSFEALQSYHQGRAPMLWERQSLLKTRLVAGDRALFTRAWEEVLVPSVWVRPLPPDAATETRHMRERMERETAGENAARANPKTGKGGVADIDFLAQYLQLVHGRVRPALRTPHTRDALRLLTEAGLLDESTAETLLGAHAFLRRVEMRLRLMRDRAAAHVPRRGPELLRLARSLGYTGDPASALLADYDAWTGRVRAIFEMTVAEPESTTA